MASRGISPPLPLLPRPAQPTSPGMSASRPRPSDQGIHRPGSMDDAFLDVAEQAQNALAVFLL